jgi:hypothetical protein
MMRPCQLAARLAVVAWTLAAATAVRADEPAPAADAAAAPPALRCGWLDQPTPGNATLVDRDGEWTIGLQGGHQAGGPRPRFRTGQWVRTGHGSAGYGCACLKVRADAVTQEITAIVSARAQPLATCRKDPALKGKEPQNPLK